MISVTSKSWTTVLIVAAVGLSILLAASPAAREQARQGAEQFGAIMVQIFVSLGEAFRSLLHLNIHLRNG
jgi:hypothetical protein